MEDLGSWQITTLRRIRKRKWSIVGSLLRTNGRRLTADATATLEAFCASEGASGEITGLSEAASLSIWLKRGGGGAWLEYGTTTAARHRLQPVVRTCH